ncbi:hypothetical protein ES703_100947 [subsurface metagenome]
MASLTFLISSIRSSPRDGVGAERTGEGRTPSVEIPPGLDGVAETGIAVSIGAEALTDCACLVEISRAFTSARKRFKGPWDIAKCTGVVIPKNTTVLVEFLGLVEDAIYFTRVKAVGDDAPCRISAAFINRHVAEIVGPKASPKTKAVTK